MPLIVRREYEGSSGAAESAERISFRINQLRLDSRIYRGGPVPAGGHRAVSQLDIPVVSISPWLRGSDGVAPFPAVTIDMPQCNVVVIGLMQSPPCLAPRVCRACPTAMSASSIRV